MYQMLVTAMSHLNNACAILSVLDNEPVQKRNRSGSIDTIMLGLFYPRSKAFEQIHVSVYLC